MKKLTQEEISEILELLSKKYENPKPMLDFTTSFELLVATVLSAQCTDVRVNKVTSHLYKLANTPKDIINLGQKELESIIKSCGLSKTKSTNIVSLSQMLIDHYDSQVPASIEELVKLPGVGRKTANVVVSNAFGIPAIAVDTHVFRVANRIGLAKSKNVDGTEKDLRKNIPENLWTDAHHWLIYHGRQVCNARNPKCGECMLKNLCLYHRKGLNNVG
ncbi:endonuclease III [Alkalibacter mobilis]|uniref:endonuclease III n=1 Tax=Alkalibacter mobilis TaxID=2787712 RepID=UPI0018A06CB2|nr:endonuclease III [Alkalibacter mobilis]MBF7096879.1 endonuclease III [Alkalibacter mobilis]